jgi:hypothetical protein
MVNVFERFENLDKNWINMRILAQAMRGKVAAGLLPEHADAIEAERKCCREFKRWCSERRNLLDDQTQKLPPDERAFYEADRSVFESWKRHVLTHRRGRCTWESIQRR